MNNVLIVGSIGLDSLKTPYGEKNGILGGSVSYASVAASIFSPVGIVGVVGQDFPDEYLQLFKERGIDTTGLEISEGKTFKWKGFYEGDMNQAHTVETQLNAFGEFAPVLTDDIADCDYLFLANIHPAIQLSVLKQVKKPKFTMLDTMNLWISNTKDELIEVIKQVDLVLVNEGEARMLCDTPNLIAAAKQILDMGPKYVAIKKGEHGALLFDKEGNVFASPAYPMEQVKDPTGAGDTFAGGLVGHLAKCGEINFENLKQAVIVGTSLASFTAEEFSLDKLVTVNKSILESRYNEMMNLTSFAMLPEEVTV